MSDPPLPPSDDDAPGDPTWGTPDGADGPPPAGGDPDQLGDLSQYDELIGLETPADGAEPVPTEPIDGAEGADAGDTGAEAGDTGADAADTGADAAETAVLAATVAGGIEPTEVVPVAADGTAGLSITQQLRRKRVSHRRYVIRRVVVGVLSLAIVAALVAAGIVLFGGDDEDSADDPVTPAGSSAPTASTEPLASAATSDAATTIPTTTVAPTTTVPRTVPAAVPASGDTDDDTTTTSRPRGTTTTTRPGDTTDTTESPDTTETSDTTEPDLPEYDLDKTPDCEMQGSARLDDSGPDVACLEERLEEVTVGGVDFDVDEVFDEDTDTAVRQFQRANDLIVDGIAGTETATLLRIWPGSND